MQNEISLLPPTIASATSPVRPFSPLPIISPHLLTDRPTNRMRTVINLKEDIVFARWWVCSDFFEKKVSKGASSFSASPAADTNRPLHPFKDRKNTTHRGTPNQALPLQYPRGVCLFMPVQVETGRPTTA